MNNFNLNVHSYYSILKSILSIDDIIEYYKKNNLNFAILTDYNLSGSIEFYNKCIKNNLKPIIGLHYQNDQLDLIILAKNFDGFKNIIKISSNHELKKEFILNELLDDNNFIISKNDSYINEKNKVFYSKDIYCKEINYNNKNDAIVYEIIRAIDTNKTFDSINKIEKKDLFSWENDFGFLSDLQKANFNKIINECNLEIKDSQNKLPVYNKNKNSKEYLYQLAIDGLIEKLKIKDDKIPKKYYERLMHELDVINTLQFNDYFLIVGDFINFAKKNNIIVGPGRGSAAGSLVSYCLNITEIDPIKYGLIFERFLNKDRNTMPDIDVDVMDARRDELIDYIFNKYNIDNTCQIITFQRIKYKMAIRDIGRVLNIPLNVIDTITKYISIDFKDSIITYAKENKFLKSYYNSYPELFEMAQKIYNIPRQFSTHAAGILIANQKMSNVIPVTKGMNEYQLSQLSMEYLEQFGLNKIDILGLKNLTIIYETIELIKKRTNKEINLYAINLEDKTIFDEIKKANTIGIFQLESPGMRATLSKIQPENLEDISITSALFRPGPQQMINDYVKTRKDKKLITYFNDNFKRILQNTNGFCIYQEQVIEIIKCVTGFDTARADIFRRAISKKKIELFDAMKNNFFIAAKKQNYQDEDIHKIYNWIIEFANYGFNHSHSLSYALISYQMMFLKVYYPLEFITTLLCHDVASSVKNSAYFTEAKKMNLKIHNVDIIHSKENFSIYNDGIIFGFCAIKGFGPELTNKLISIQNKLDKQDCFKTISCLAKNKISEKNIEILIKIGAFDCFNYDRNYLLTNLKTIIRNYEASDVFNIAYKQCEPIDDELKAKYEFEYLSYSFSNNQNIKMFEQLQQTFNLYHLNDKNKPDNFMTLVKIKAIKKIMTKTNKLMYFINIQDIDLDYSVACFNQEIAQNFEIQQFYILEIREKNNKLDIIKVHKKI